MRPKKPHKAKLKRPPSKTLQRMLPDPSSAPSTNDKVRNAILGAIALALDPRNIRLQGAVVSAMAPPIPSVATGSEPFRATCDHEEIVMALAFAIEDPCGLEAIRLARAAVSLVANRNPRDFAALEIRINELSWQYERLPRL
jgi:hypothetical protein